MSLYVTGDKHGVIEMDELLPFYHAIGKNLNAQDYLLIAGDFGLLFAPEPTEKEIQWMDWLSSAPWTTLFIDGNHENFTRLDALPTEIRFGNPVGVVKDKKIFHLRRGYIYTIAGCSCFAFGGALSLDRCFRRPGLSWWEREIPSEEEIVRGWQSLEAVHWNVDYVFTHMAPLSVLIELLRTKYIGVQINPCHVPRDPVAIYFDTLIPRLHFQKWYFGHLHVQTPPFVLQTKKQGAFQGVYRHVLPIEVENKEQSTELAVKETCTYSLSQILLKSKSLIKLIEQHGEVLNMWLKFRKPPQAHDIMAFQSIVRRSTCNEIEESIHISQNKGYYHLLLILKVEYKEKQH
ncbi:MAG: metallophosphoesterase [Aminobacterium sp.]|jgi:hypothetical protein|uniref:metallophosphoesterase n=1 Tax=Aminobacterium sp. TaxID=1872491 RepID=UPI001BCB3DF7|nr:metallophosphoesterase [Aminobacterium sp.]MEA4877670.1 metallophosphoesterase [Aminobacterium sp.]